MNGTFYSQLMWKQLDFELLVCSIYFQQLAKVKEKKNRNHVNADRMSTRGQFC